MLAFLCTHIELQKKQKTKKHYINRISIFLFTFVWSFLWKYNQVATWQNQQNECAPSEDSDQPGHLPSLIRVFAVRMKKAWVLSYPLRARRRLWSDWADAQADLSLRWVHSHFVGFVMSRLILFITCTTSPSRIHKTFCCLDGFDLKSLQFTVYHELNCLNNKTV